MPGKGRIGMGSGSAQPQNIFKGDMTANLGREPATPSHGNFHARPSSSSRSSSRHITGISIPSSARGSSSFSLNNSFGDQTPRTPRTSSVRTYGSEPSRDQKERPINRLKNETPNVTQFHGFDPRSAAPGSVKMNQHARGEFGAQKHRDTDAFRTRTGDNSRFAPPPNNSSIGLARPTSLHQQRVNRFDVTSKMGGGGKKSKKRKSRKYKKSRKHRKKTYRRKRI